MLDLSHVVAAVAVDVRCARPAAFSRRAFR